MSVFTRAWWAATASSAFRQGVQAALPLFVLIAASGSVTGWEGGLLSVAAAVAFTFVTAFRALTVDPTAPVWQQVTVRALKAAAGTSLGVTIAAWSDLLTIDYQAAALTVLATTATAVAHFYLDPPRPAGAYALAA